MVGIWLPDPREQTYFFCIVSYTFSTTSTTTSSATTQSDSPTSSISTRHHHHNHYYHLHLHLYHHEDDQDNDKNNKDKNNHQKNNNSIWIYDLNIGGDGTSKYLFSRARECSCHGSSRAFGSTSSFGLQPIQRLLHRKWRYVLMFHCMRKLIIHIATVLVSQMVFDSLSVCPSVCLFEECSSVRNSPWSSIKITVERG